MRYRGQECEKIEVVARCWTACFCAALFVYCVQWYQVIAGSIFVFSKLKYTSERYHTPPPSLSLTDKQMSAQLSAQTRPPQPLGLCDLCCLSEACSSLVTPPAICFVHCKLAPCNFSLFNLFFKTVGQKKHLLRPCYHG